MFTPNIFNTRLHEANASALLGWMLERWKDEPLASLLIITRGGEGQALNARIRVRLSEVRKEMKGENMIQFGFETALFRWTSLDGVTSDAISYRRVVHGRHKMLSAMQRVGKLGTQS